MGDNGIFDSYLICQALGWEWNFQSMVILSIAPILIIGGAIFIIFWLIPWILELIE